MRHCILLPLLIPLAPVVLSPSEDAVKKELASFQGAWQAVAIQRTDGQPAPADEVQNTRLRVEGARFTLTGKTFSISGTFTIDPTRAPKTIDVALDGSGKDQTKLLGIYRIEGDTRTSRFALPNNARPVDFGPAREGTVGFTWKRQSP